jgi:hypothetical protein
MKNTLVILIFFCFSVTKADFVPIDFISLIHRADKIVSGKIICVDESVFELQVNKSLNSKNEVLTINKFEDWICSIRWSQYFVGQKIMVFLNENDKGLSPIGAGNEGELPIFDDKVYPNLISWPFDYGVLKKIEPQPEHKKYDGELYSGIELGLDFLWEYVKTIKECFEFKVVGYSRVKSAKWTCAIEKALEVKNSNKLYALTFERLTTNANTGYN